MNSDFRLLTNHALALLCIAQDSEARIRDVAGRLGITERAAQRIVGELVEARYLERARIGRRNRYEMGERLPLSQPIQRVLALGSFLSNHLDQSGEPTAQPQTATGASGQ